MVFLIADPLDMINFREILSCHGQYKIATGTLKRLIQNFSNPKELKMMRVTIFGTGYVGLVTGT